MTDAAYLRKFIMLEPYTKGQNLKGYLKLEVRNGIGKTEINVDGFKNIPEKNVLNAYLMTKKNEGVLAHIGEINVKKSGKGNLKKEINPKSVDNTGVAVEDFDVVLIESSDGTRNLANITLTGKLKNESEEIVNLVDQFSTMKIKNVRFDQVETSQEVEEETQKEVYTQIEDEIVEEDIPSIVEQEDTIDNIQEDEDLIENRMQYAGESIKNDGDNIECDVDSNAPNEKYLTEEDMVEVKQPNTKDMQPINNPMDNSEVDNGPLSRRTLLTEKDMVDVKTPHTREMEQLHESMHMGQTDLKPATKTHLTEKDMVDVRTPHTREMRHVHDVINELNEEPLVQEQKEQEQNEMYNYDAFDETYKQNIENFYGYSIDKTYNYMQNAMNYKDQVYSYTQNILKFFKETDVLKTRLEGYKWWKIEYNSTGNHYRSFLPFHNYILSNSVPYPSMFNVMPTYKLIKKYKHYIFGVMMVNKDVKYYVYGIPGRFSKTEQPYGGMTGFCTWCPRKGINREKLGYWLLHVDSLTGRNARPLKPTPPR